MPLNARQAAYLAERMIRSEAGYPFIDHSIKLGSRQAMAGVEYALLGIKEGGYHRVRIGPHLAYGEHGLAGLAPPNAVLVVELWLRQIDSIGKRA